MRRLATIIKSADNSHVLGVVINERPDRGHLTFTCYDEYDAAKKYAEDILHYKNIVNNFNGSLSGDSFNVHGELMYRGTLFFRSVADDSVIFMQRQGNETQEAQA
jgi:hypothetical protein